MDIEYMLSLDAQLKEYDEWSEANQYYEYNMRGELGNDSYGGVVE